MEFNLYCPLIEHKISEVDYMENQSCAEGLLIPDSMPGDTGQKKIGEIFVCLVLITNLNELEELE